MGVSDTLRRRKAPERLLRLEILERRELLSANLKLSALRVASPAMYPLAIGADVLFELDVKNAGDTRSEPVTGELDVTRYGNPRVLYHPPVSIPAIGKGKTVTIPIPAQGGDPWHVVANGLFTATATIPPEGSAGDPRNNDNSVSLKVQVGLPDFEILPLKWEPRIVKVIPSVDTASPSRHEVGDLTVVGRPTYIEVKVRNNGKGPCQSYVELEVTRWGVNEKPEWVGTVEFDLRHGETLRAIARNSNEKDSFPPVWRPKHAGVYIVTAIADPENAVRESSEDNNRSSRAVHSHANLPASPGQPLVWLRSMLTPDEGGGPGGLVTSYFRSDHVPGPILSKLGDKPLYVPDDPNPDPSLKPLEWVASSYDNALAVIALNASGSRGDMKKAASILKELAYLQDESGAFVSSWHAPLPKKIAPVNSRRTVGNTAWVILAVCRYTEKSHDNSFLSMARKAAEWILQRQDPVTKLVKGGVNADNTAIEFMSTEHNVDAVAALEGLARFLPADRARYTAKAQEIRGGIAKYLWIESEGRFRRGVKWEGANLVNDDYKVSDAQTWAVLSLGRKGPNGEDYRRALDWVVRLCTFDKEEYYSPRLSGIDFNRDDKTKTDTISPEMTESLALAFLSIGREKKYKSYHAEATRLRNRDGGVRYTSRAGDFDETGEKTVTLESVAGTAWWLFADLRRNAFRPGTIRGT